MGAEDSEALPRQPAVWEVAVKIGESRCSASSWIDYYPAALICNCWIMEGCGLCGPVNGQIWWVWLTDSDAPSGPPERLWEDSREGSNL